jgi:hypothetical protein
VTDGITPEVYDNLASVAAAVTAIHGVSLLVDAALVLEGTLANIAATHLAGGGGTAVTPPTFSAGATYSPDDQTITINAWVSALFSALRTAGYIA